METPRIEMKPIAAEMEKSVPVRKRATAPPLAATGAPSSTMRVSRAFFTELYTRNIMTSRVTGTMIRRRAVVSRN